MKQTYELIAPCHFGLEAVLKKEILDLGYEIASVEDGRVTFIGDDEATLSTTTGPSKPAFLAMVATGAVRAFLTMSTPIFSSGSSISTALRQMQDKQSW